MAREAFIERKFEPATLAIIEKANSIIEEYQEKGFTLTLRQLYYQFVARDLIQNLQSEYKRLGSIINDARLAGLVDWGAIEDRTRFLRSPSSWDDPSDIIAGAAQSYQEDLWAGQTRRVEVWVEKDALLGVIEPACERWRVPFLACRGNTSQSETYNAGQRILARAHDRNQKTLVLHLGDHDPNGIDMTRDNRERLDMFTDHQGLLELRRIALNMDQVQEHRPPPNPAKKTDSRFRSYVEQFGTKCWELDALAPEVIDGLLEEHIKGAVDLRAWRRALADEKRNRELLETASERWSEIEEFLA